MQIAAANGRGCNSDDHIAGLLDFQIRDILDGDLVPALPDNCSHTSLPSGQGGHSELTVTRRPVMKMPLGS